MNRSLLATIVTMSVAALMACGGGDTRESRETLGTTSSRLAAPAQAPIPVNPSTGQPSWKGTPVELMFADAFASCAYEAPVGSLDAVGTFQEDGYLQYIQTQMVTAVCRYQTGTTWTDYSTSAAQPELRWLNQRNDPKCNKDASTKKVDTSAALENKMVALHPISIPVEAPFAGGRADATTAAAATRAVTLPVTNLCIAQHLRSHSPGASAGDALLLSAADQRALLALTKERAQMAMLQFALLARVFATPRLSDAEAAAVSKVDIPNGYYGYPLSFIPMLQQWAQSGTATEAKLRTLGQDFATAIQLHAVVSHELVDLLSRSGAARLPRGASPSDPSWAASGRLNAAAVEMWGPGAWRERAMAALYGGDPLVEDTSGSTPWAHFLDGKNPGDGGSETSTEWPDVNDASFVSTRIKDPKLKELYALASQADALYLVKTPSFVVDPLSHYRCRDVDVTSTYDRLYRATEAYVRTNQCTTYDPVSNTCQQYALADIPSSTGFSTFELWQKYRITPEHASALTTWLKDIIAKECQRDRKELWDGAWRTTTIAFWNRGALDFAGEIESSGASQEYYHLKSPELRPRVLRETAGLFSRYSGFWIPPQIHPEADPATQGFSVGAIVGGSVVGAPPDETNGPQEMRLMGAIPALAVTRDAVVKAALDAAALPSSAQAQIAAFLEKKQLALAVIENEIGKDSVSITPATTLAASPVMISILDGCCNIMTATLDRMVLAPTDGAQDVEITYPADDTFWSSTGTYTLFAVPDEPLATSVVAHPGSKAFGRDAAAILVNPRAKSGTLVPSTPPPSGTVSSSAMHVTLPIPRSDEQWSYIVQRQDGATIDYKPLASHIRKYSLLTMNVGQYLAFNGALSNTAAGLLAKDLNDPTRPAFDGFGLPNAWLPPTDPALFGGTTGEDAVASYLQKARASAQDATAAVKEAFETMLQTQQDEAALAASVAKSAKVADLERSALCGSSRCDTSVLSAPTSIKDLWNASQSDPFENWDTLLTQTCKPGANATFDQLLATLAPFQRLDCLATMFLSKAGFPTDGVSMLSTVVRQRSAPAVPSFVEYAGGTLQAVAIEQWTSLRELEDRVRGLIASTKAATATVARFQIEFQDSSAQALEMKKRCDALYSELTHGGQKPKSFADMDWGDDVSSSTGSGTSKGNGFGIGFGLPFLTESWGWSDGTSTSSSSTPMSLGARRRLCESYRAKVNEATWRLNEANIQAYANIQERAAEFTAAVGRVRQASASGAALRHQTELAIARSKLEVDLLRDSQTTSFGLFRQLHSYDAWRAKALLDGARRSAAVARKAIESRYVVNLSELDKPEPLVAGPSTWADEVYDYDLDMPSAVGLSVGDPVAGGIYSNKILDYVSNLENFVNGFSIARPTSVMRDDAEVISLPGPRGLDANATDGRAQAWSYFCPSGPNAGWRASAPNVNPSDVCGPAPNRPTRASLLFALDPWGRLHGDIADEPFARRYNARWGNLAVNLVGTGVLDCSKATDPDTCYTQPFVRYQLSHRGVPWITDAEQSWTILPVPGGNIEGAKALAAEQWLDPIVNAWSKPYVASVARSELSVRPLGGSYEIEFNLGPEVVLERIQRVQLLVGTSYWVSQGQSSPAPVPSGSAPTIASLSYTQGDTAGGGQPIVLTGTDLSGATGVSFGGTAASITAQTPTTLTVTLPAHAAGNVNVMVTGPGGTSNALTFEYWSPALLSPTGDWGDYAGDPWANAGSVGGTLYNGANGPTVGAALGGHNTADFGGAQYLTTSGWGEAYTPYGPYTVFGLAPVSWTPDVARDGLQSGGPRWERVGREGSSRRSTRRRSSGSYGRAGRARGRSPASWT